MLATIATPTHSAAARSRALDELPKRAKSLGPHVVTWLKNLARRCAMGGLLNLDVLSHCIQLAQEAFEVQEYSIAMAFLTPVRIVVHIFPSVIAAKGCFGSLVGLFGSCIETNSSELKRRIQELGLITILSGILAAAASTRSSTESVFVRVCLETIIYFAVYIPHLIFSFSLLMSLPAAMTKEPILGCAHNL